MEYTELSAKKRYEDVEVVVYFSGSMGNLYQLEQWVMPFYALDKVMPILIIARDIKVYEWVQANTSFQLAYCKTMDSLLALYENNQFKCILYVNNASTNFQSLMNNTAMHVHINHGESEKSSTFSNRAKAYDAVFVVSDAGYERYQQNLINITMDRFIKIGRPQLDWTPSISEPDTDRKVVLYGATWEGTHLSMNYSSLPDFGLQIVDEILSSDEYYLIYRPHPHTGSRDKKTAMVDKKIRQTLSQHSHGMTLDKCDINAVFKLSDIALLDNSAIAVDFLRYDKPILMTDYFHRIRGRKSQPKIVDACTLMNEANMDQLLPTLASELEHDSLRAQRQQMQAYFLGCYAEGESTQQFIQEVQKIVIQRDELVSAVFD